MKVLEKLVKARSLLQQSGLKKSGKNGFAGYGYFELADFLPEVTRLSEQLKIACAVSFTADLATLTIFDLESDNKVTFTSPMSTASLKNSHEVQNLGAVQTYLKRYLYMHAFEIVEADVLDATLNPEKQPVTKADPASNVKKVFGMKGGASTPQEVAKIKQLLATVDGKGAPLFSETRKREFSSMRTSKTAAEVIALIKEEVQRLIAQPDIF